MPAWIIALLKWGGLALALIGVVAVVSVEWFLPAPAPGRAPQPTAAPIWLYSVLFVIGVIAAIVGYALAGSKE